MLRKLSNFIITGVLGIGILFIIIIWFNLVDQRVEPWIGKISIFFLFPFLCIFVAHVITNEIIDMMGYYKIFDCFLKKEYFIFTIICITYFCSVMFEETSFIFGIIVFTAIIMSIVIKSRR